MRSKVIHARSRIPAWKYSLTFDLPDSVVRFEPCRESMWSTKQGPDSSNWGIVHPSGRKAPWAQRLRVIGVGALGNFRRPAKSSSHHEEIRIFIAPPGVAHAQFRSRMPPWPLRLFPSGRSRGAMRGDNLAIPSTTVRNEFVSARGARFCK